jgi:hypothetical protein
LLPTPIAQKKALREEGLAKLEETEGFEPSMEF